MIKSMFNKSSLVVNVASFTKFFAEGCKLTDIPQLAEMIQKIALGCLILTGSIFGDFYSGQMFEVQLPIFIMFLPN